MTNLIGNAVKFTDRGQVQVNGRVLSSDGEQVVYRFEVRDSGTGIRSEVIPTLFNSFTQADSSTTRKFGGTGLGLVIVKRLCELMGGDCGVESEFGQGSTFWFTLALQRDTQVRPADMLNVTQHLRILAPGVDESGTDFHVLVAEDNRVNQEVAAALLESLGCTCRTAMTLKIGKSGAAAAPSSSFLKNAVPLISWIYPLSHEVIPRWSRRRFCHIRAISARPGTARRPGLAWEMARYDKICASMTIENLPREIEGIKSRRSAMDFEAFFKTSWTACIRKAATAFLPILSVIAAGASQRLEQRSGHSLVDAVAFGHQYVKSGARLADAGRQDAQVLRDVQHVSRANLRIPLQREREPERGALAKLALDAAIAAHEFAQPFDDHETQARAAELARGAAVGLGERVE